MWTSQQCDLSKASRYTDAPTCERRKDMLPAPFPAWICCSVSFTVCLPSCNIQCAGPREEQHLAIQPGRSNHASSQEHKEGPEAMEASSMSIGTQGQQSSGHEQQRGPKWITALPSPDSLCPHLQSHHVISGDSFPLSQPVILQGRPTSH